MIKLVPPGVGVGVGDGGVTGVGDAVGDGVGVGVGVGVGAPHVPMPLFSVLPVILKTLPPAAGIVSAITSRA
jgi:hypothetical protein